MGAGVANAADGTGPRCSNVEFISDLMNFSRYGAMAQLVVIYALEHYVDAVIQNEGRVREDMAGGMINPEAWVGACKEIKVKLNARLGTGPGSRSDPTYGTEVDGVVQEGKS